MTPLSRRFSDQQRGLVEAAVAEAELGTSCEVVPVVAEASGRYDRGEDLVGLWCAIVAASATWMLLPSHHSDPATGDWGTSSSVLGLFSLVAAIIAGFLVGAVAASRVPWLRRLATPRRQMCEEVAGRAREVFFDRRIHHTERATGILIYVSLLEHITVVLADRQVLEHPQLGQAFLDRVCETLTKSLATHHPADAIVEAIHLARGPLSAGLPRLTNDVSEHSDALILID